MHILIVHEVSYLTKPVYEYQDFAERLAKMGHQITVVDFDENGSGEKVDVDVSRTGMSKVRLIRPKFSRLPIWKFFSAKLESNKLIYNILAECNVDAVLLYSVFINGVATVKICNKFNIPVVYRVLDAYHLLHPNFIAKAILKNGERFIYQNVARISTTNYEMIPYVINIAQENNKTIPIVHRHGVDVDHFSVRERDSSLCALWNIVPTDKVILFLGTTYNFSSLDSIVAQMPKILKYSSNIRLIIVGAGELDLKLKHQVAALNLSHSVILTGMVDYDMVPRYLSLADLTINPFQINSITENIIPIKVLQYLSCGKPLLCSPLKDVIKNFPEIESGVVYQSVDNISAYCSRMLEIVLDKPLLDLLSHSSRDYVSRKFDVKRTLDELLLLFTS